MQFYNPHQRQSCLSLSAKKLVFPAAKFFSRDWAEKVVNPEDSFPKWFVQEMGKQVFFCRKDYSYVGTSFRSSFSELAKLRPQIKEETMKQATKQLFLCPPLKRSGFLVDGIIPLLMANPQLEAKRLAEALEPVIVNLRSNKKTFLPQSLLGLLQSDFQTTCHQTKRFFAKALVSGSIIRAVSAVEQKNGEMADKTLYIKGFFGAKGYTSGFEPQSNSVYLVKIEPGKGLVGAKFSYALCRPGLASYFREAEAQVMRQGYYVPMEKWTDI